MAKYSPELGGIVEKVWGTTEHLFSGNNIEVHRICVVKRGYCSKHRHDHKHNLFHVESGTLLIRRSVAGGGDELDGFACQLSAGQSFSVPPHIWHQFEATEPTVAYEIYWVELDEDIERANVGGVVPDALL